MRAHNGAYPHDGGCTGCADAHRCNACGGDLRRDAGRCTNGRCSHCHSLICTAGGSTSAGHGFGDVGRYVDKITEYGLTQRLSRPVRVF